VKVPQLKVPGHRVTPLDLPYLTKTDWPTRLISRRLTEPARLAVPEIIPTLPDWPYQPELIPTHSDRPGLNPTLRPDLPDLSSLDDTPPRTKSDQPSPT